MDEKGFLVKELSHCVKNNLAVILSLIDLQGSDLEEESAKQKFLQLHNRVETIAHAHKLFSYGTGQIQKAHLYLIDYFKEVLQSHLSSGIRSFVFKVKGDDVDFPMDKAIPLAMVLNELITNFLKHALQNDGENLFLIIEVSNTEGLLTIKYRDNGKKFSVKETSSGFGMLIIEGMSAQTSAEFTRINSEYTISLKYE